MLGNEHLGFEFTGNMDTSQDQEKNLIQAAKEGSISAFERLLAFYEKKIFSYIYGFIRQKQDAEDLTQETFIKAYKNLSALEPEKGIRAWLYAVATNTTYDWLRRRSSHPELFIIDDPENPFETIDEAIPYIPIERATDLKSALTKLKPVYRTVLLLYYKEDLSYQEIASVLSVPLNTVKTHLSRAKQALKKELESKAEVGETSLPL